MDTAKKQKDDSETAFKDARTGYQTARKNLTKLCNNKVDENLETQKLAKFSEAVKKRRQERSISQREEDIREIEAQIDVIQLNIDEQTRKIEKNQGRSQGRRLKP